MTPASPARPSRRSAPAGTSPRLPGMPPDAVTRCLCHAVHLDGELRDYVLHTLVNPHLQAVCPSFGVNLVAVARHASLAQRREDRRRSALFVIRLAAAVAIGLGFLLRSGAVAVGLLLPVLAAAWGVLAWSLRAGRLSALDAVTSRTPPEDQADPLPADTEDRLRKLDRANVVIYADGQGDPFVGSGRRLQYVQVHPVDVTRAGRDHSGNKRTLKPFDAVTLHEYLAKQVPAMGFTGLRARNRLYVRGDYARHVPGLLPDEFASPCALIDSRWVKSGAEHPVPRARTYVCMERVMDGGQLVVGMYVRAWLEQNLLSIERTLYFLPPLKIRYQPSRDLMARGGAGAAWDAVFTATARTLPVLAGQPLSGGRGNVAADLKKAEDMARREIRAGYQHDYGARTSLREAVAGYDTKGHFEEADVLDGVKRLSRRLLDCIQQFLDDHGVDTSDFSHQVQNITTSVSNIGTVQAGTAVVGGQGNIVTGHGAVNNFGAGAPAGPAGTGAP
jgi:hypothetical protein